MFRFYSGLKCHGYLVMSRAFNYLVAPSLVPTAALDDSVSAVPGLG